jgi:signal recognition particle subunit SRP19
MDEEYFCIYPVYFDLRRSISGGRKYNRSLCLENPSYRELLDATRKLQLECIEEPTKKHPKEHFMSGRIKIKKIYGKKFVIEGLRQTVLDERKCASRAKEEMKVEEKTLNKGYVKNQMNLIPRKKKKGKKNK